MRRLKTVGALVCLAVALSLSGCGDQGWVRTSPDGKYATVVIPHEISDDEKYVELSLYDLDRNTITPIARFTLVGSRGGAGGSRRLLRQYHLVGVGGDALGDAVEHAGATWENRVVRVLRDYGCILVVEL